MHRSLPSDPQLSPGEFHTWPDGDDRCKFKRVEVVVLVTLRMPQEENGENDNF